GRADHASGAGGHRAAEAIGLIRGRRAGAGVRGTVRLIQRRGRRRRRRALTAQSGGFYLRPTDPRRTRDGTSGETLSNERRVPATRSYVATWEATAAANRPGPHHDPEPADCGQRQELKHGKENHRLYQTAGTGGVGPHLPPHPA